MQQPSRLVRPQGNAESGAGQRPAPASVPVPSLTPRKGAELDVLIRSLEDLYQLGFNVKSQWRSPATHISTADIVARKIQRLFYTAQPTLDDALASFATTATFIPKELRADALLEVLRSKTQCATPPSTKNIPSKSLKTSQLSVEDTPRSRGIFDNFRRDGAGALRDDTPDPGSPTDEDEDDFVTPPSPRATSRSSSRSPSPSVTSKSAKRRTEASTHLSLQGTARKRPHDGSNENGKSSKLTKILKETGPFIKPQVPAPSKPRPHFMKPSLGMAPSLNALPASQSTVNTSFNTVSSSQQTQPDTANTSFTSDADYTEVSKGSFTRTSSTTSGSLDNQDFLAVGAKLSQDVLATEAHSEPSNNPSQGRDSSSTWGSSLPEEDLLDASAKVESLHATSSFGPRHLSPQRVAQHIGGSQPSRWPAKNGVFASAKSDAAVLNQSFPPLPGVSAQLSLDKVSINTERPANGAALSRVQRHSPRERTPVESPSKIAHHIRDIPGQGLFVSEPDPSLRAMPFFALFICQRIALERSIPVAELVRDMDMPSAFADSAVFWDSLHKHPKISHVRFKDADRLWSPAQRDYNGYTFKGQINLRSKRSGPIFQLNLHPILPDKSCRFQRRFGADRFLYLNVPELDVKAWTGGTQEDLSIIRERWEEWLNTEHRFLRRKWRVFHIEPMKKAKKRGRNAEVTHRSRIVLFATEGFGISKKITVGELLDWFLPFARNQEQSFCKAYARFDLGLSRTTPTLTFRPSQLQFVKDRRAIGDLEATEFDDPGFQWAEIPKNIVMNDGCSRISVGAAIEIWRMLMSSWGISRPLPSAFQGRIGGAKGLWMISDESFTKDPEHLRTWIEISESQLKFKPHPEDEFDASYDKARLTFEVSNFSSSPARSDLHISFIPIMADRGVPRDDIATYMRERLDTARIDLLERVKDPVRLYEYVHKNGSTTREGSDMAWQAALPLILEDKIKLLLESGFSPCSLQVLAKNIIRFVMKQHLLQESKLKTPLGKATYLYGVADPIGVLRPGEVHIQFSSSFVDEVTDEKYLNLKGHNILVARQPAIRNSDIQKVRAVNHPALSHLVDLAVFPSIGQFPLAGKLQGGDYDGDIFWLCWEEKLVQPFRNAPAPVQSPDPEQYGIEVDKRKLKDLEVNANDVASVDRFLKEAFRFRSAPSLLGIVTTYLDKLAYHENRLSSFKLDRLSDIHDLLVDAPKQGYTFTMAHWQRYLQNSLKCRLRLRQQIHKDAMDACAAVKDSGADVDKTREKQYRYKSENIVDYLYFEVVRSHNVVTMKQVKDLLSSASEADTDLIFPHDELAKLQDPTINEELRQAKEQISLLYNSWNSNTHKDDKERRIEDFARVVEDLYARFTAIEPANKDNPIVKAWLHPWLRPCFRLWDRLRASILYTKLQNDKAQTFVFQMAGDELAKIKAENFPHTRYIVANIRANMKPKPIKAPVPDEEWEEDDDEVASVLEPRMA